MNPDLSSFTVAMLILVVGLWICLHFMIRAFAASFGGDAFGQRVGCALRRIYGRFFGRIFGSLGGGVLWLLGQIFGRIGAGIVWCLERLGAGIVALITRAWQALRTRP